MSCDLTLLANEAIRGLSPYQAGKPESELARELGISDIVKLASNENPLGPGELASKAAQAAISQLHRYPDSNGFFLKQALATKLKVTPQQITLGNGSNDLLELLARTFAGPDSQVIFSQYAFVVYPIATQAVGATAVVTPANAYGHDLDAMLTAINDTTRLIYIANPNNPTGNYLTPDALQRFLAQVPERVIVVLDEAYFEYAEHDADHAIAWLAQFRNLVVTRTFSKAYGLASLRVGYSVSDPAIADLLNRVRQPFNVNAIALAAAEAALADDVYLQRSVELNRAGMAQLEAYFERAGFTYIPSKGNFITFDLEQPALPVYQQLLQEGVIVRPIVPYGLPNHLRVSVGLESENQRFIDAMQKLGIKGEK